MERVLDVEDGRDGRGARGEERLVAEGADREERAGLPGPEVAAEAQVREIAEGVVHPGEKDVVGGCRLEGRREINVSVNERADLFENVALVPEVPDVRGQQDALVGNEVVRGRVWNEPLATRQLKQVRSPQTAGVVADCERR